MTTPIDVVEIRNLLDDLREPDQRIYFLDLALTSIIGWLSFSLVLYSTFLPVQIFWFMVAAFALYRGIAFIHELVHQPSMNKFRYFWHAVIGIPLMVPFLLYLPVHRPHHNSSIYGTPKDGEYEQFQGRLPVIMTKLFLGNFLTPIMVWVRFSILTPISFFFPVLGEKIIPSFIHLSLRLTFRADPLTGSVKRESSIIELFCCLKGWALFGLLVSGFQATVILWACTLIAIATLNMIRGVTSTHQYSELESGRETREQMLDSVNIVGGGIVTKLLCPVGTRWHALHHIVPQVPYHNLALADERLVFRLPVDSEYHDVCAQNMLDGWRLLKTSKI